MNYVHRMSLMIHTASCDNFLEAQGIPSYYEALLRNLSRQTLREFELVYVDTFYEENKEKHKQKVKEYKEKINYNATLTTEKKKEYARRAYLNKKAKLKKKLENQNI